MSQSTSDAIAQAADRFARDFPHAMTRAALDVIAERERQIEAEDCSHEHDDRYHNAGDLACAGAAYAVYAARGLAGTDGRHAFMAAAVRIPAVIWQRLWPFDRGSWKPKDPRRDLVRATALMLAEIEKYDRRKARELAAQNADATALGGIIDAGNGPLP